MFVETVLEMCAPEMCVLKLYQNASSKVSGAGANANSVQVVVLCTAGDGEGDRPGGI